MVVRRRLEGGAATEDAEVAAHLQACEGCRAHAAILAALGRLEPGGADPATVRRIMTALPTAPWQRRRLAAWLPLAAGLTLIAAGLSLLGGVPAPAAVAGLPAALGGGVGWLGAALLDLIASARGGADAARLLATAGGAWLVLWLALTVAGGSWAVVALVRRPRAGERP